VVSSTRSVEAPIVLVSMTVANVDYSKLMVLPLVLQAFEACVRRTLALQAGRVMPPSSIKLQLTPGSVRVSARVASLDDSQASSWQSKLRASPSIRDRLATSIEAVNGIAAACTGPVSVTSFEARAEVQLSMGSDSNLNLVECAVFLATIGFSILIVLGTVAVATFLCGNCGGVESHRSSFFYDLLTPDQSRSGKARHGHLISEFDDLEAEPDHDCEWDRKTHDSGTLQHLSRAAQEARFQLRNAPRAGVPRRGSFSSFSSTTGETLGMIREESESSSRSMSTIVSPFTP